MAQNISLLGANYTAVPAVDLPKTGGGTARFTDTSDADATSADIASGKTAYVNGQKITGTGGGSSNEYVVELYNDGGIWKPLQTYDDIEAAYLAGKLLSTVTGEDPEVVSSSGIFVYPSRSMPVIVPTFEYWIRTFDSANDTLTDTYYEYTYGDQVTQKTQQTYVLPPSGTLAITSNGNGIDVKDYEFVNVNVPIPPQIKNAQVATGTKRIAATAYTDVGYEITVAKTGTYNVHWAGWRSSTSGTNGAQLYVNGTASGNAVTTFDATWTNVQNGSRANVSLTQGDKVTLRARSRGTSYYMYIFFLSIEEV